MQNGKISVLSLETIWCSLEAKKGGVAYDPTADQVFGAVVATPGQPRVGTYPTGDWHPAIWETTADPNVYAIGTQVGPGVIPLTAGITYSLFVSWDDSPDVPVELSGTFKAF